MNWIPVQESLPAINETVMLYSEYHGISIGYRVTDWPPMKFGLNAEDWEREYMVFGFEAEISPSVTHWAPMPAKPEPYASPQS